MWSGFLLLATVGWIFLWVPARAGGPTHFAFRSELRPPMAALHLAIPVEDVSASNFGELAPTAGYSYAFLLLVLLLHLLFRSVQLKAVLRLLNRLHPNWRGAFDDFASSCVLAAVNWASLQSCAPPPPVTGGGVMSYCPPNSFLTSTATNSMRF